MTLFILFRYWWPGVALDVRRFILTCERCQRADTRFKKVAPNLHSVPVPTEPWTQVGVDICSLSDSDEGFKYIVVMVCYFTKWIEVKPLKTKSAEDVANFIYEVFCRHGTAAIQINDQGREFVNQVSDLLLNLFGTKQRITSAYHPQANGLVERNNRTIQNLLLKVLGDNHSKWPVALGGVVFAYNTSKQKSTGFSPFYLMYGRHPRLPMEVDADLISVDCEVSATETTVDVDDEQLKTRIASLSHLRDMIFPKAAINIKKAQLRQAKDYRKRHGSIPQLFVDDQVLMFNQRRADRKGGKHVDSWNGPFRVNQILNNGNYRLANINGTILKKQFHGSILKVFRTPEVHVPSVIQPILNPLSSSISHNNADVCVKQSDNKPADSKPSDYYNIKHLLLEIIICKKLFKVDIL